MTEERLDQMIREAFELEFAEIERRIMEEEPHIFSDEFEQKMNQLIGQPGYDDWNSLRTKRHIRFRYLLVAVLLLILGTSTVMGSDLIKEQMQRIVYTVFPEYVQIDQKEDAVSADTQSYVFEKPSYIPDGFHVFKEEKDEETGHYMVTWSDDEGNRISYMQSEISSSTMAVTSNGEKPKEVKIGDTIGKLGEDDSGYHSLFFEKGEKMYSIVGPISEQDIIKMAESIE